MMTMMGLLETCYIFLTCQKRTCDAVVMALTYYLWWLLYNFLYKLSFFQHYIYKEGSRKQRILNASMFLLYIIRSIFRLSLLFK